MSNDFCWDMLLHAPPNRVFGSLVRAASTEGQLCSVESFGSVLTFFPSRRQPVLHAQMRATVRSCPQGSLVSIEPVCDGHGPAEAMASQADAVASLMRGLSRHFTGEKLLASVS